MPKKEHLSNDEVQCSLFMLSTKTNSSQFFTHLTTLIKSTHKAGHGSVHLSQKRLTHSNIPEDSEVVDNPLWDLKPPNPLPVLIRASNGACPKVRKAGGKVKCATVVKPEDLEGFFERYAEVCKKGFEGLKKRDRSKKKKKGKGAKKDGE